MRVRSPAARFLAVVALLTVAASVAGVAVAAPGLDSHGAVEDRQTVAANETVVESINQTMRIDVRPNGDARWTLMMRATVANGSDVPLSDLAAAYERGETPYLSLDPYRAASERVGPAVGRPMEITNVSDREATVVDRTIAMEVSFTWTNVGERVDDSLIVRDVFNGKTGRWFSGLESFQRLVVAPPSGYDISSVDDRATLRNRTLRWYGPLSFDGASPYVIYVESDAPGSVSPSTTAPTTPSNVTSTTPPPGQQGDGGLLVPAVVVLLVGLLAVLAVVASRSDRPLVPPSDEPGAEASDGGSETVEPANGKTVDPPREVPESEPDEGPTPAGDPGAATSSEGPEADVDDDANGADEMDEIDEQLLSDEERVERLLERNGGRMKQANIVSETNWSNAKVSQLLSSMAEDGRIEKLRIGRENLISFPDGDDGQDEF